LLEGAELGAGEGGVGYGAVEEGLEEILRRGISGRVRSGIVGDVRVGSLLPRRVP